MSRAYLNYDGTEVPIDLRAAMIRRRQQKAIEDRMWKGVLATVGFWYEMYNWCIEDFGSCRGHKGSPKVNHVKGLKEIIQKPLNILFFL